jgi:hypothetical protein
VHDAVRLDSSTDLERDRLAARVEAFMAEEFGCISIQATQPHTLAVAAYGEVGGHHRRSAGTLRDG